jgi:diadenosine tetraphosphate (Ap4A) HIT family hydrolase
MSDSTDACPFCALPPTRVADANALAVAVEDAFPVASGHTLVVPRRHVASVFDLTTDEVAAVMELLVRAKARLDGLYLPDGYNVGVNVGRDAGQTVMHAHVHLIPRRGGDVSNPRGGVRNVIPGKGDYLADVPVEEPTRG